MLIKHKWYELLNAAGIIETAMLISAKITINTTRRLPVFLHSRRSAWSGSYHGYPIHIIGAHAYYRPHRPVDNAKEASPLLCSFLLLA